MNAPAKQWNPWPWALIGFFVCLIGAIASFVTFALRQDMDLVREDYYAEEIRFQNQIDRMTRTRAFEGEIAIVHDPESQRIAIAIPSSHAGGNPSGTVQLYRPSDADLDFEQPLKLAQDSNVHILHAAKLAAGRWKVRVLWTVNELEYFTEREILLPRPQPARN